MLSFQGLLALALLSVVHAQAAGQSSTVAAAGPDCAADGAGDYSLSKHIAGVFIILGVSSVGIITTITVSTTASLKDRQSVITALHLAKFFGIGVIAATAWIHLLPDAFANFTNPCLDGYWTVYGGANYVGLFGLIAGFLVQGIELFAVNQGNRTHAFAAAHHGDHHHHNVYINAHDPERALTLDDVVNSAHAAPSPSPSPEIVKVDEKVTSIKAPLSESSRVAAIGTIVLEAGIIFHSLIIGLALGTTADDGFTSLLIAIAFHQFTEGTALGVLIAQLPTKSLSKMYGAGLLYPLTTPIGIGIGIAIRNTYNENSQTSILVQGIFDSLSAGILMYNAYCELISREINQSTKFRSLSTTLKAASMFFLYAGAGVMALIGLWA
ncbi:high-affinity Zn(2+) transporter zrt1 [Thoreauomyces humboldtii]|nr:high-affinity Zn(2+) transporter zrt1 [Thoreauomyces humboldtii]